MARRAKSAPQSGFAYLLAAPFAALGDLLTAVISANGRVNARR